MIILYWKNKARNILAISHLQMYRVCYLLSFLLSSSFPQQCMYEKIWLENNVCYFFSYIFFFFTPPMGCFCELPRHICIEIWQNRNSIHFFRSCTVPEIVYILYSLSIFINHTELVNVTNFYVFRQCVIPFFEAKKYKWDKTCC